MSTTGVDRVLIVKLGALGDIVHAIPVAAALRRALPSVHIDWLVSPRHRPILELVPVIDRRLEMTDSRMFGDRRRAAAQPVRRRARSSGADQVGVPGTCVGRQARDRVFVALPSRAARAAVLHRDARSWRRRHVPRKRNTCRADEPWSARSRSAFVPARRRRSFRSRSSTPAWRSESSSRPVDDTPSSMSARPGRTSDGCRRDSRRSRPRYAPYTGCPRSSSGGLARSRSPAK